MLRWVGIGCAGALGVALIATGVGYAAPDKAAPAAAKTAAADKSAADAKAPGAGKGEPFPKDPGKAEPNAKSDAKSGAKAGPESADKTDGKPDERSGDKAEAAAADAAGHKSDSTTTSAASKKTAKKKPPVDDSTPSIGEEPSPASPPPLTMSGLRDEMRRESAPVNIDPDSAPRTKVEQMLAEITKARQALHDDTGRLEAMLAQDGNGDSAGGGAPGAAKPAGAAAKNPLDVLAKALRGIKPDQSAPIVSRLDKRLAATVLQRMPPADAGKIMGAMKPDAAAELATQIAIRQPRNEARP